MGETWHERRVVCNRQISRESKSEAIQKVETKEQEAKWKTEGEYPTGDARFDKFIKFIFAHENVLNEEGKVIPENQVGDSGGLTKYGIDRSSHPDVDVAGLNKEKATAIYFAEWKKLGISKMKYPLGEVYFDTKVNGGNNTLLHRSGGDAKTFVDLRAIHYRWLAKENPKNEKFLKGWLQRAADLRHYIMDNPAEPAPTK